jgi:hypothetical protein
MNNFFCTIKNKDSENNKKVVNFANYLCSSAIREYNFIISILYFSLRKD